MLNYLEKNTYWSKVKKSLPSKLLKRSRQGLCFRVGCVTVLIFRHGLILGLPLVSVVQQSLPALLKASRVVKWWKGSWHRSSDLWPVLGYCLPFAFVYSVQVMQQNRKNSIFQHVGSSTENLHWDSGKLTGWMMIWECKPNTFVCALRLPLF